MIKRLLFTLATLLLLATISRAQCAGGVTPGAPTSGVISHLGWTPTAVRYIDYTTGSDSADGLCETIINGHGPWKHGPGMTGNKGGGTDNCQSTCATFNPTAGTAIVYKGGTVWPYTVFPLDWRWSGSGTTTTNGFGCAGTGCIVAATIDPNWNLGVVNSIAPMRDLGGCSGIPSVSITGGGGAGATAIVTMKGGPTQFAGGNSLTAFYTITNGGTSTYTSNPSVSVTGTGCVGILAQADIQRAIFDLGDKSSVVWTYSDLACTGISAFQFGIIESGCSARGNNTVLDSIEVRNLSYNDQAASCFPNNCEPGVVKWVENVNVTFRNMYLHNLHASSQTVAGTDGAQFLWTSYNSATPSGEIANSIVSDGEPAFQCTPSTTTFCSFGGEGAVASNYVHNNNVSWTVWEFAGPGEGSTAHFNEYAHNEAWANTASNVGGHTDLFYLLGYQSGANLKVHDNVYYNEDAGAFSQINTTRGSQYWLYNNTCPQFCGGVSGNSFVLDPTCAGGCGASGNFNFYMFNNSIVPISNGFCMAVGSGGLSSTFAAMILTIKDNLCITTQAGSHWYIQQGTAPGNVNGNTSPTDTTPDSANLVTSSNPGGLTRANFLSPTSGGGATDPSVFNGANLTSLCSVNPDACTANNNPGAQYATVTQSASGGWSAGPMIFNGGSTPTAASPVCAPGSGTYSGPQSATCSTTAGPVICYTLDGSTPSTNGTTGCTHGTLYSGPVSITVTENLNIIAGGTGYLDSLLATFNYTITTPQAGTPTFSPVAGTYSSTQSVTISSSAFTVKCYTTNGATPATNGGTGCTTGTLYSGAISVSSSETVKAVAGGTGYTDSAVGSAAYVINPSAATPAISPAAGTYSATQSVTITDASSGAVICYTIDNSTPSTNGVSGCSHGTLYSTAISVSTTQTIKAIAGGTGYSDSAVASSTFTITPPASTPTCSPVGGTYTSPQSPTCSTISSGAIQCYTLDGSTPITNGTSGCTHGTLYAGAISISVSETLKIAAGGSGYSDSSPASYTYVIEGAAGNPTFSLASGTYVGTQATAIMSSAFTVICYTTDNSTPITNGSTGCTNGAVYSTSITISVSQTVKARAGGTGYTDSAVVSASYVIAVAYHGTQVGPGMGMSKGVQVTGR